MDNAQTDKLVEAREKIVAKLLLSECHMEPSDRNRLAAEIVDALSAHHEAEIAAAVERAAQIADQEAIEGAHLMDAAKSERRRDYELNRVRGAQRIATAIRQQKGRT